MFVGCLLYADDIILLSPSVTGLQEMLNSDSCFNLITVSTTSLDVVLAESSAFNPFKPSDAKCDCETLQ